MGTRPHAPFFVGYGKRQLHGPSGSHHEHAKLPATFQGGGAPKLVCTCDPALFSGNVWGTDVYTADSSVCHAALHSGAVPRTGGEVVAIAARGSRRTRALLETG